MSLTTEQKMTKGKSKKVIIHLITMTIKKEYKYGRVLEQKLP